MKKILFLLVFLPTVLFSQNNWYAAQGVWDNAFVIDTLAVGSDDTYWTDAFNLYAYISFNIDVVAPDSTVSISKIKLFQWDSKDSSKASYIMDLSWKSHSSNSGATSLSAAGYYSANPANVGVFSVNSKAWLCIKTSATNADSGVSVIIRGSGWNTNPR